MSETTDIPIPEERIRELLHRHEELTAELAQGSLSGAAYAERARELAELEPVVEAIAAWRKAKEERAELEELAEGADPELRALARSELPEAREREQTARDRLLKALLPKDAADERSVILEIRAGTGGEEAALFAGDLLRMYERYAQLHGWRLAIISASSSDLGGFKEVVAEVRGRGVYARLKFESGVHRVQRVPVTEAGGRIHTSAATVAVLPEPEAIDVAIDEKDLRIDVFRASGPGGQSVNTTDSAVRITHLPTGIVVQQQDEKSQHKNKEKAMKVLRARLFEHKRRQVESQRAAARRAQVGSGDRSERIRTYNFPQGRVTDHRIGLTLYKLDQVLAGEALDEIIDALIAADEAARLAEMGQTDTAAARSPPSAS
ncbi:MAG: peptide chain release factor 1 [Alphaproteobacteria bacterium]|nr:MAG: peptide chain release factor 1 [Alphaproteobacteria bacterium]